MINSKCCCEKEYIIFKNYIAKRQLFWDSSHSEKVDDAYYYFPEKIISFENNFFKKGNNFKKIDRLETKSFGRY